MDCVAAPQLLNVRMPSSLRPDRSATIRAVMRWCAGIALAAYAICVWPANFKHALDGIELPQIANNWLYHGARLAFQPVLIWWALYCAEIIDWP